jgi:transcriptional regulator with XRE-family HTH domain
MAKRSPLPVDQLVGQNIRICRLQRKLSQTQLGERVGVTFQQIQKYERGANRVGASRLTQIADVLQVPLMSLFDGASTVSDVSPESSPRYLLAKPHALRLVQAFDKIADDKTRLALLGVIECIAEDGPAKDQEKSARKRSRT